MTRGPERAPTWELGLLPLQLGARQAPTNAPLPDTLPLAVCVDAASGRVVQRYDPAVADPLARAYAIGSPLGTPLAHGGLGKPGLDDFFSFIQAARGDSGLAGTRVLEIGSGDGALLATIESHGAVAIGVEPGAAAADRARSRGLTVLNEPFSAEHLDGTFDLIVHHAVLEHVSEPVGFLADQLSLLNDGGLVICSVPDCTEPLARGDISMLMHEHWSYFTPASLASVARAAGAEVVRGRPSRAAGAVYSALRAAGDGRQADGGPCALSAGFEARAERSITQLRRWIEQRNSESSSIGVYCPPRFLNYQTLIGPPAATVRFFDDDPSLTGRYLPPVPIPIETRADLLKDPVDHVLVMSWTFGTRLADELAREPVLKRARISTIDRVLGDP